MHSPKSDIMDGKRGFHVSKCVNSVCKLPTNRNESIFSAPSRRRLKSRPPQCVLFSAGLCATRAHLSLSVSFSLLGKDEERHVAGGVGRYGNGCNLGVGSDERNCRRLSFFIRLALIVFFTFHRRL